MGFNKVMLTGCALRAPETRWISDSLPVVEFPMAVERTYTLSSGKERTDRLEILVQAYGKRLAERCKGAAGGEVHVEGRLRIESRKENDGWVYEFSIVAETVEFEGAAPVPPATPPPAEPRRARAPRQALAQSA